MSAAGMSAAGAASSPSASLRALIIPLALAQFICSYAGSSMNVAIQPMATDLGTNVIGIQLVITLFTLTMATLMIPGSKLSDIWGRKRCFNIGIILYGVGALISAFAPHLILLIIGNSLLEGIGSALMIPPIYILITVATTDNLGTRAKSFGVISAAAGLGAATGPLIGGILTSAISWRASFGLQVLVIGVILILGRQIVNIQQSGPKPTFDIWGAVLSAIGLLFVVLGILQSGNYGWIIAREPFTIGSLTIIEAGGISPIWFFIGIGAIFLACFFIHIRSQERHDKQPLLATRLFRNRTSNLGLITQNTQWLILQGSFFVISVYLQTVRGFNAIQTGLVLTPVTVGTLLSSMSAERLAQRRPQRTLIIAGFATTIFGIILLVLLARATSPILNFLPGLFFMGVGIGVMLTSSVNVVQSSFPERDQGDISGLSRSISNLGSSLGTSIVGSVLVLTIASGNKSYLYALLVMAGFALIGLAASILLPADQK